MYRQEAALVQGRSTPAQVATSLVVMSVAGLVWASPSLAAAPAPYAPPADLPGARLESSPGAGGAQAWVQRVDTARPVQRLTPRERGKRRNRYAHGVEVEANPDARVEIVTKRSLDGRSGEYQVNVYEKGAPDEIVPPVEGRPSMVRRGLVTRGRRSPRRLQSSGREIPAVSATINNARVSGYAVWRRFIFGADSRKYYGAENASGQAYARNQAYWVNWVQLQNRYSPYTQITSWSPSNGIRTGSCRNIGISAGFGGFGISSSTPVCRGEVTWGRIASWNNFYARWNGNARGPARKGLQTVVTRQTTRGRPVGLRASFVVQWCWRPFLTVNKCGVY